MSNNVCSLVKARDVALMAVFMGALGFTLGAVVGVATGVSILACAILFGVGTAIMGAEVFLVSDWTKNLTDCQGALITMGTALAIFVTTLMVGVILGLLTPGIALIIGIMAAAVFLGAIGQDYHGETAKTLKIISQE